MKKIASSLLSIFAVPAAILKKSKIDNFIGGLLVGAIFSLLVNIVTVQVQEIIHKQRVLEAIENEIIFNIFQANNIMSQSKRSVDENRTPNPFYVVRSYAGNIWQQSSEPLEYVAQLDQNVQIAVTGFYTITLPQENTLVDKLNAIRTKNLDNCFDMENFKGPSVKQTEYCREFEKSLLILESRTAEDVAKQGTDVLKVFHPTRDRLSDPILSFLMGKKSIRALSGK